MDCDHGNRLNQLLLGESYPFLSLSLATVWVGFDFVYVLCIKLHMILQFRIGFSLIIESLQHLFSLAFGIKCELSNVSLSVSLIEGIQWQLGSVKGIKKLKQSFSISVVKLKKFFLSQKLFRNLKHTHANLRR